MAEFREYATVGCIGVACRWLTGHHVSMATGVYGRCVMRAGQIEETVFAFAPPGSQ